MSTSTPPDRPGDEAAPDELGTAENLCPDCNGSGRDASGGQCPTCEGTGRVNEGVGGG
jgi:RecJ-like exonuclease